MPSIRAARPQDWVHFLALAAAEGWRVPHLEGLLFTGPWRHFVHVLASDELFCGLVTAVGHERSGWIGNLLVPARLRGRGYGATLFAAALAALHAAQLRSLWLTASPQGRPLYEKSGFVTVAQVERWVSRRGRRPGVVVPAAGDAVEVLRRYDRAAWGEERAALLDKLVPHGQVLACDDAVALLQQEPALQIIGPWYSASGCPRANRQLLHNLLAMADPGAEIVIDLLADAPLRSLLVGAGFACQGSSALMVSGEAAAVKPAMMMALASLGSFG